MPVYLWNIKRHLSEKRKNYWITTIYAHSSDDKNPGFVFKVSLEQGVVENYQKITVILVVIN